MWIFWYYKLIRLTVAYILTKLQRCDTRLEESGQILWTSSLSQWVMYQITSPPITSNNPAFLSFNKRARILPWDRLVKRKPLKNALGEELIGFCGTHSPYIYVCMSRVTIDLSTLLMTSGDQKQGPSCGPAGGRSFVYICLVRSNHLIYVEFLLVETISNSINLEILRPD